MPASLSFRQRKILYAVISEYVASGEPVSSQKISGNYGINLSSASIRAELATLEQQGYLMQPHTSAGRVPTVLGFRIFVDALRRVHEVTTAERDRIVNEIHALHGDPEEVIRETGKILSQITHAATVFTAPKPEEEPLYELRLITLPQHQPHGQILMVIVSQTGSVQNRIVTGEALSGKELEEIHNYLAAHTRGKTLAQLRAFISEQVDSDSSDYVYAQRALSIVNAAMESEARTEPLIIEGQDHLFGRPEFRDADKVKAFLRTFEAKQKLLDIIDLALQEGPAGVLIGPETHIEGTDDVSVISAEYSTHHSTGTVAVVGPKRIDYERVVPLVELTAQVMGDVLIKNK